jgi:hypothetical protein
VLAQGACRGVNGARSCSLRVHTSYDVLSIADANAAVWLHQLDFIVDSPVGTLSSADLTGLIHLRQPGSRMWMTSVDMLIGTRGGSCAQITQTAILLGKGTKAYVQGAPQNVPRKCAACS